MTIIFRGHIEKLEIGTVTIAVEIARLSSPIVLKVKRGEADVYRPGDAVEIRITPLSAHSAAEEGK